MTTSARRLLWPGLMTAAMMIVLLVRGSWQVKRLLWKQALLAQIEHAEAAPAIPLTQSAADALPPPPPRTAQWPNRDCRRHSRKFSVTGTYLG